jgi:putative two-component system response regulator
MLNIVLVDDNPGDQKLFQDTLQETGIEYRLRTASSGREGLELVKQEKPDLMVLDLMMPGMSGYDVYSALRFDPNNKGVLPIILLTVRKEEIDPRLGELKKVYYMQKPCKLEELRNMIRDIFKKKAC